LLDNGKNIFQALHQNKWLYVEYLNKEQKVTRYWIAIIGINLTRKTLAVEGLHLGQHTVAQFNIGIENIRSSAVIEGSYHKTDPQLIADIQRRDHHYKALFGSVANLKTLSYLEDCNRLDTPPYCKDFSLIKHIDGESFSNNRVTLSEQQFKDIVSEFRKSTTEDPYKGPLGFKKEGARSTLLQQIALNVLSLHTKKGLYVLAYKPLYLDVSKKQLVAGHLAICTEFKVGNKGAWEEQRIQQYLDNDCLELLREFEQNAETIKDRIAEHPSAPSIDDRPYLMSICFDSIIDLKTEYAGISLLYENDTVSVPLKAFFGELVSRPEKRKEYDIVMLDKKADLDQILAINKAIKYPLAYIQGPPGTGKTSTIINTIINAFFYERTVLFASNNNHPINGVFTSLGRLKYRNFSIPFPVVRLGSSRVQNQALDYMRALHEKVESTPIYEATLKKKKKAESQKARQLTELLARYEERLELLERRECIERLLESSGSLHFTAELEARQLKKIEEGLQRIGQIQHEEALSLLPNDTDALSMFLHYSSALHLKRLSEPKYKELLEIAYDTKSAPGERAALFNRYLADSNNLRNFLRVFPIVITTCISARRLGEPKPSFDMVILDEASQCNIATALVPIVRGSSLMLVGDPQQLNPVINLDPLASEKLRRNYQVAERYDYCSNSIYKAFLASDSVSDEILLSHHYRSDERIINFNNKKYYNGKLKIRTKPSEAPPLQYYNVSLDQSDVRNTAPGEVSAIIDYIKQHPDEKIGIITPFTNQRELIHLALATESITSVACGTVHSFQGDEQDTILFSTGLAAKTSARTYAWLASNRELINVATSRAKKRLVILSNKQNLKRLHAGVEGTDDLYELIEYVATQGESRITKLDSASRALGIKPYSTQIENAFLESLDHALGNLFVSGAKFAVHKEVPISQVFQENLACLHLFYTGRFDFVIYERTSPVKEIPVLAIELDGKEHYEEEEVKRRDREKQAICSKHKLTLIRVDNSYARRYNCIKNILSDYFKRR